MLKKLIKYDLKDIYKVLVIFYGISLFFGILTRIFFSVENSFIMDVIGKICSGVSISMIFNILINNVMRLWHRFKSNFYGDESYLTHTLPVSKTALNLSKFLTSIITLFTSTLVITLTLFIAYYSKTNLEILKGLLLPLATIYDSTIVTIVLLFIFICFLEIMNMLQSGYTGILLGHRKNNNKMGYSVLFGFGTYLLTQVFVLTIVFIYALFDKNLMNLFYTVDNLNIDTIKLCILLATVSYALINCILSIVNLKVFNKGVNVD